MSLFGDFKKAAGTVTGAVENVAKGAEYVATHPDKVVDTAGKVINYGIHHPGEVANIAKKELIHSFTDPKELAINAALLVGTMGTGFLAKEGAELAVKTGVEVAGKTAAKVAGETAAEVASETAGKVATETAGKAAGEVATKAAAETSRKAVFDTALESGRWNPIQKATTALRESGAQRILAGGGENPSLLRQGVASLVQGSSGTMPTQLEGMSDAAYSLQKTAWRAKQIEKRAGQLQGLEHGVQAAADPMGYAMKAGGGGKGGGGGMDATHPVSAYGGDPGRSQSFAYGSTTPQGDTTISSVTAPQQAAQGPSLRSRISEFNQTGRIQTKSGFGMQVRTTGANGLHFWQGPQREALGGIGKDYDWRNQGPLRPIQQPKYRFSFTPQGKVGTGGAEQIEGGSVEAKVPAIVPAPKSSMYAKAGLAMEVPKSDEAPQFDYGGKGGQGRFTFPELSQPKTSSGPRIMQAAGTGADRGGAQGRNDSFVSGSVYGVAADTTIGNTAAWNNTGQGSFVFPQLDQPKSQQPPDITETGTFKPATPLRPLSMPLQNRGVKAKQTLGV
jgi:hypothetical protein